MPIDPSSPQSLPVAHHNDLLQEADAVPQGVTIRSPDAYIPIDHLRDWIRRGTPEALIAVRRLLAEKTPFVATATEQAAAAAFVGLRWNSEHLEETATLMQEFIAAGQIEIEQKITYQLDSFGRKTGDFDNVQGKTPLTAAVESRNLEATLVLVRAGAIDVTDFGAIVLESAFAGALDKKMAGFDAMVKRAWGDLNEPNARIREAVMTWRISKETGSAAHSTAAVSSAEVPEPSTEARRRRSSI